MSSVYRWRPAFQADFAARLAWCVRPYADANHPPVVRVAGERKRKAKAGEVVSLDAGGSTDPDGDRLEFSWRVYPATTDVARQVVIEGRDRRNARVVVPSGFEGRSIPVLLSVTDQGVPRLTRYGRVLITVPTAE
jgi:hypothetical protein